VGRSDFRLLIDTMRGALRFDGCGPRGSRSIVVRVCAAVRRHAGARTRCTGTTPAIAAFRVRRVKIWSRSCRRCPVAADRCGGSSGHAGSRPRRRVHAWPSRARRVLAEVRSAGEPGLEPDSSRRIATKEDQGRDRARTDRCRDRRRERIGPALAAAATDQGCASCWSTSVPMP
jgi:hypothetical protein